MYRGDGGQDRNLTRGESESQCGGGDNTQCTEVTGVRTGT